MWSVLKNWIYNLIVRSGILYRFMGIVYRIHFLFVEKFHNGDKVMDADGCSMNVTRWNGRNMAAFGPRMYSKIKGMNVRKDDVILCGFPKTGCHWTYEILYALVHKKAAVSKNGKIGEGMIDAMPEIVLESVPSPRILNTHVRYDELPDLVRKHNNKIILTIRCPKDAIVSYYNHVKNDRSFYKYDGTFDNYFEMFLSGQIDYGCYFEFYRLWEKAMNSQEQNQIYFLSFEDLKEHPVRTIKDIADFLGQPVSQEFAEKVADVTSFSKLKGKREGNALFRKGVVGDWRNWLTEEQARRVDAVWRQKMAGFKMPAASNRAYCT